MAGMTVVPISRLDNGDIDLDDLRQKASENAEYLAALMITWPSTHGVFEDTIATVADIIHQYGGQVYLDGANMNAQVRLLSPRRSGADVCHLNLHKTLRHPAWRRRPRRWSNWRGQTLSAVFARAPSHFGQRRSRHRCRRRCPVGQRTYLYDFLDVCCMLGRDGVRQATRAAIVNANYMAKRLADTYPILYTGRNGLIAHECIIDLQTV